jgi:hypothetical protein
MRHLNGAYTTYVNITWKRVGHLFRGAKLKDIGERFGIRDAAVSQASRRMAFKAETDQHMQKMLDGSRHFFEMCRVEL